MTVLSTHNLIFEYSKGTPFRTGALKGVSLDFNKGEIIGIIGHTGSGKSTLLQCLNGLIKPDSGEVLLDGEDINRSKQATRQCRFKVGLCFQYPEYQLFESTVYKDVAFGPKNMGLDEKEIDRRVRSAVKFTGLSEDYLEKSPFDLSGGEKRRVAIAGVLSMEPEVLVLDEPTAGLDPVGKKALLSLIKEYNRTTGNTVIFVSHSMDDVAAVSDRIVVMSDGKAALSGTVKEVYSQGERLLSLGLDVPEITRIFLELKNAGFSVPDDVYTVSDGANALLDFLKKRGAYNG